MEMGIDLTAIHFVYLMFILFIILMMVLKKDTSLVCIAGIFIIAWIATGSFTASVSGIFTSFVFAIKELLPIILVISIIVSMSRSMLDTGINDVMVAPFAKLIKGPNLAFWIIGFLMLFISTFFWPSPAVALMGAVLLPVAIRVGLPAIGVAVAMNLFGHGIALSGDYVIQGAPKLTADGAGIPVSSVIEASVPLVIVMGVVTTATAFLLLKRDMKKGLLAAGEKPAGSTAPPDAKVSGLKPVYKKLFAFFIPVFFILDIVAMVLFHLQGDAATALVGGTSIMILLLITMAGSRKSGFEKVTKYLIDGLQFGFQVFGPVIPIAAFFYLGGDGFHTMIGADLPGASRGIVNDLGGALASVMPVSKEIGALTTAGVGVITGLDGSGFSGISLAGSIAALFAHAIGSGAATLTALGQIAAIFVGGGTIIPWALIPAAAICNVDPFELARRNLIPVITGLIVTTIVAMFLI